MVNTNAPRIERIRVWTPDTKLYIPHEKGEVVFVFPPFGPHFYKSVGKEILNKLLKVPTGDYIASLLHTAYCNHKNEYEFEKIRELIELRLLWVFNKNLWTSEGVYVIPDLEVTDKFPDISELEKMLKGGQEINGIRFSEDKRIRFAPKGSYKSDDHFSESLSKDGFVIANYNVDGAKKLEEVSTTLKDKPYISGTPYNINAKISKSKLRLSSIGTKEGRLCISGLNNDCYHFIDTAYGFMGGHRIPADNFSGIAFGVL